MHVRIKQAPSKNIVEYLIIGAGPAALCLIPQLLKAKMDPASIMWVDPRFSLGDFGGILSEGSSVPGNTAVSSYRQVIEGIYHALPAVRPPPFPVFAFDKLSPSMVPSLKIAAEPLLYISTQLENIVHPIRGIATKVEKSLNYFITEIIQANNQPLILRSKRVILAIGAQPKTLSLPSSCAHIITVKPEIAFIYSQLKHYMESQKNISRVAVIGSSHSAALASMHLLQLGCRVKQFMNKKYLFAQTKIAPDGSRFTQFDNTGLKGEVATFTRKLINGDFPYLENHFTSVLIEDKKQAQLLLTDHLPHCSHVITAIGYEARPSVTVNGLSVSELKHNSYTTEFSEIPGLFGIGIAFPQQKKAVSGEIEFAVGVSKFWNTVCDPQIIERILS